MDYYVTNNINIRLPGGNHFSRDLDERKGLQNYVCLSFIKKYPMMFKDPIRERDNIVLEIDLDVFFWKNTLFSDKNATRNDALVGESIENF